MTLDERVQEAVGAIIRRVHIEHIVRESIEAAVEEVEDRVANERDSYLERIEELDAENKKLPGSNRLWEGRYNELGKRIADAVEAEREACAEIADYAEETWIAEQIRARSNGGAK